MSNRGSLGKYVGFTLITLLRLQNKVLFSLSSYPQVHLIGQLVEKSNTIFQKNAPQATIVSPLIKAFLKNATEFGTTTGPVLNAVLEIDAIIMSQ